MYQELGVEILKVSHDLTDKTRFNDLTADKSVYIFSPIRNLFCFHGNLASMRLLFNSLQSVD